MKLSTVNTIYWVAVVGFWGILLGDFTTPGKLPAPLGLIEDICLYVLIAAQFYMWGTRRTAKKTTAYEMSN